ncbi:MAG TPA: hypothetical protein VMG12_43480 [Polyangiaceae bacterium]|nr:hypothetical protein [Polyangiaceae bacterium]
MKRRSIVGTTSAEALHGVRPLALALLLAACHGGGTTEVTPATAHTPEASTPEASTPEVSADDDLSPARATPPSSPEASPAPSGPGDTGGSAESGSSAESGGPGSPRSSAPLAPSRRGPPFEAPPLSLQKLAPNQICTTLGSVRPSGTSLLVEDTKLRATLAGSSGHAIELAFRYLGATAETSKLRSGSDRRQLGLELAARDTCNLLYVMWRIEPESELVVQVKRNGAQSTHAECENRGYHRLRPTRSTPVPELTPGATHRLRAELADGTLRVLVDGSDVWSGPLDADALELEGKSGLRSDNARFELLELRADERAGAPATCPER